MVTEAQWLPFILYGAAIALILLGLLGMVLSQHAVRVVLSLLLLESGVNLMLIIAGYRFDAVAPVVLGQFDPTVSFVDPIPQAMVLTAIVIGVGVQAVALALILRIFRATGLVNMRQIFQRLQQDMKP